VKKYELIIFDCDGTLVDSEPLTNRVIAEMIRGYGLPMTTDRCLDLFAGKTIGHITDYIRDQGQNIDNDEFEKDYRRRCESIFREELQPVPGIKYLRVDFTQRMTCRRGNQSQICSYMYAKSEAVILVKPWS